MSTVPPKVPWRSSCDFVNESFSEPEWLIQEVLPKGSIILFSGREGSFKTWLSIDWAFAVAEGIPWLNRECQAGAVLYLDAENPHQVFLPRVKAIGASQNLNVWRWQDSDFPTSLADQHLLDAAQVHDLIIIDSLRRFMEGLDENNANDMSIITGHLRQLTQGGATLLVGHHATKNPKQKGYRGSTELGAGVDICMHIETIFSDRLEMTVTKTRYHEDPDITLRVSKTKDRPIFKEIGGPPVSSTQASDTELQAILVIIEGLLRSTGLPPNQSQIVQDANKNGLGSRNTILRRLREGIGPYWTSKLDGRSRVYEPVHLSKSPVSGQVDNTSPHQTQPVQASNSHEGGQVDNSDPEESQPIQDSNTYVLEQVDNSTGEPPEPVHLSNSIASGHVDNREPAKDRPVHLSNPPVIEKLDTSSSPADPPDLSNLSTAPVTGQVDTSSEILLDVPAIGSTIHFLDREGDFSQGALESIHEWPGLPEEIVYRTGDGRWVPPSRVLVNSQSAPR